MKNDKDKHLKCVVIIGGGAAGFFTAINIKEAHSEIKVIILEKNKNVLQKVKISGGGRCNVTNACFEPKELIKNYPRGNKELLGPFYQFTPRDTMQWFKNRGVGLKTEKDNRVFPITDSSKTVIDCFLNLVEKLKIEVQTSQNVLDFYPEKNKWIVKTKDQRFLSDYLVVAAGSSNKIWEISKNIGHSLVPAVPSLFTFNIIDKTMEDLSGISVFNASVKIEGFNYKTQGALLITHWGFSGPAILKLSAFAAYFLAEQKYRYKVMINWLSIHKNEAFEQLLLKKREQLTTKVLSKTGFTEIPKRLWERLVHLAGIDANKNWAEISNKKLQDLAEQLTNSVFEANGKSTFKEEFVTAGGIDLKDINWKCFESKLHKNLFFVGEILNIDALTGGFNFQNAWTGAYCIAKSIVKDNF